MPYIKNEDRDQYHKGLITLPIPKDPGELNYLLTKICIAYVDTHGHRYKHINDVVGALECCKLEFYRRLAAFYEDEKIASNGDVYT